MTKDQSSIKKAAVLLGKMYLNLAQENKNQRILPLDSWALPQKFGTESWQIWLAMDNIFTKSTTPAMRRKNYLDAFSLIIPEVRRSALIWTDETLWIHEGNLNRLAARLRIDDNLNYKLHDTAKLISSLVGGIEPSPQDIQSGYNNLKTRNPNYVLPFNKLDKTFVESGIPESRKLRDETYSVLRKRITSVISKHPNIDDVLKILFSHSKGIDILKNYDKSAKDGKEFAIAIVNQAISATSEFHEKIKSNPDHVWRYSALVLGGVTKLGILEIGGFPEYAVDIGRVLSQDLVGRVVQNFGLVLMCVGLVVTGPAGALVLGAVDLALNGAATVMTYLREREQDLGLQASAFRLEGQEFATTGGYTDTVLAGAAALISAMSLLKAGNKLIKEAKPARPEELPISILIDKKQQQRIAAKIEEQIDPQAMRIKSHSVDNKLTLPDNRMLSNRIEPSATKNNFARSAASDTSIGSSSHIMESAGSRPPKIQKDAVTDPFTKEHLGYRSASAKTERSVITAIRADVAEAEAYKAALLNGEIGLQRPFKANVRGPDFITAARDSNGKIIIFANDVKSSTVGKFPRPDIDIDKWLEDVKKSVAPGRLNLNNPTLEAEIRNAVQNRKILLRQINVKSGSINVKGTSEPEDFWRFL